MKKTQVMLEMVIGFVLIVAFFLGIINLWIWSNAQIAGRQKKYQQQTNRLTAGEWGVTQEKMDEMKYKHKELDEKYVIGGDPFGKH